MLVSQSVRPLLRLFFFYFLFFLRELLWDGVPKGGVIGAPYPMSQLICGVMILVSEPSRFMAVLIKCT